MKVSLPIAETEEVRIESGHLAASLVQVDQMGNRSLPPPHFANSVCNSHLWICFQTPFFSLLHYSQECLFIFCCVESLLLRAGFL